MVRLNKRFYLLSFIFLGAACLVLMVVSIALDNDDLMATVTLPVLAMNVIALIFHYKAWKAIQDGYATTTPAKAIAYLFIPIYNLYWLFRSLYGFASDFNDYISRHSVEVKKLPGLLYFYQCILFVLNGVLVRLESEWSVITLFIVMIWIYINAIILIIKTSNGVNGLAVRTEDAEVTSG